MSGPDDYRCCFAASRYSCRHRVGKGREPPGQHSASSQVLNNMRVCLPQMRSPAINSQGFTESPLFVASFRHVTVTRAGLSLPASGSSCRKFHRYVYLHSRLHTKPRTPCRDSSGASRITPLAIYSGSRLGIILKHRVEGGRRPFASGTPATRGAHNSEIRVQQPDHHWFVRVSIPNRITVALTVDSFRTRSSIRNEEY